MPEPFSAAPLPRLRHRLPSEAGTADAIPHRGNGSGAGDVEHLTKHLGRPLRSYRDFVSEITANTWRQRQNADTPEPQRSMTMIYSTATVPVNPEGATPLTRA
jgi:hypothetical protein